MVTRTWDGSTPPLMVPLVDIPLSQLILIPLLAVALIPYSQYFYDMDSNPAAVLLITLKNISLFLVVYGGMHEISVRIPFIVAQKYLQGVHMDASSVQRDRRRTMLACCIGSVYETALYRIPGLIKIDPNPQSAFLVPFLLVLTTAVWVDFHFYLQHRLFHVEPLFKWFHSVHHQSYNPCVWSGLSFHPFESVVYYSAILVVLVWPAGCITHFNLTALKLILDVSPVWGHIAVGGIAGGSYDHYLHHRLKDTNFGGTTLFDKLFGTWTASIEEHRQRKQ